MKIVDARTLALFLLLVPLAAVAQSLPSQEEAAASRQEEADLEQSQAIPEGQIPASADVVAADLRRIEAMLQPDPQVSLIEAALVEREAAMVLLFAKIDRIDPNRVSARHLDDQRLPWFQLRAELEAWEALVTNRLNALQAEREDLRDERIRWEDTSRDADAEELSPELLRRIDTTLTRVLDVEARVRERRNAVGVINNRVAEIQEDIDDSIQRLDDLTEQMRGQLFAREAAPLWRSLGTAQEWPVAEEAMRAGENWAGALRAYSILRRGRLLALVALFVALLAWARELRRRSLEWPVDDPASESLRVLVGRPLSLALAFAVVASAFVLPYPVGAAADILLVLAIIPMLRVGSLVLAPDAQRALYGVAALTILAHVGSLGFDGSVVKRMLLLLVSALAFAGMAWTARRGRRSTEDRAGWHRAAYAATALFGVAVCASVFGWIGLSHMLTGATLGSLFSAFAWAIIVAAVAVLLPTVFDGRLGRALPSLRRNRAVVSRVVVRVAALLAFVVWARGCLIRFQLWGPVRAYVADVAEAGFTIGGLTLSAGSILGALSILVATFLVARFVGFVLREEVTPRFNVRRGDAQSVVTLANYAVYAIGLVLAASATGLSGTQLTVVIGALSVGIGFGLQNVVNNFVSGLILIFERPIKVGDTVQTADQWGRVQHIGIRASTIRSFDGAEIIIPNGELIAKEVTNWTRSDEIRRLDVHVGVAYGTDPEAVLEILRRVAEEHPLTLDHPEPKAQMIRFGESSLDFRARCWARVEDWIDVASDLHVAINKELKQAGITIPFPQRDLHMKSTVAPIQDEAADR